VVVYVYFKSTKRVCVELVYKGFGFVLNLVCSLLKEQGKLYE